MPPTPPRSTLDGITGILFATTDDPTPARLKPIVDRAIAQIGGVAEPWPRRSKPSARAAARPASPTFCPSAAVTGRHAAAFDCRMLDRVAGCWVDAIHPAAALVREYPPSINKSNSRQAGHR